MHSKTTLLTSELIARLDHGPVSGDIRLRAQGIIRLPAAQRPWNAIHGKCRRLLVLELLDQFLVLGRVEEGDEGAVLELGRLFRRWGA